MEYKDFLDSKITKVENVGFDPGELNPMLFDFQKDIVRWCLKKGRSAIFADCGLGKTPMQLEWARHISERTESPVLILAPLAVSRQTINEGDKFGIHVEHLESDVFGPGIYISNYEQLHNIDLDQFKGIVLDESSILKSYSGKYRNEIIDRTSHIRYKLACTATPAPNDYMELGNHSEFLGSLTRAEMLAMFFVYDSGDTQKWRLKGYSEDSYWNWMTEWAVMIRKPSDLGYEDKGFNLPELKIHQHIISAKPLSGEIFPTMARTMTERRVARKETIDERTDMASKIVNDTEGPFLIWCNLNNESALLKDKIQNAIEVKGSDSDAHKIDSFNGFSKGQVSRLVTKPKIGGFGMNWQHCNNSIFVGLSDSYEQYYQAVRRTWRFGQKKEVNVHIVIAENEGNVLANIMRKEKDAERMAQSMVNKMKQLSTAKIHTGDSNNMETYNSKIVETDKYKAIHGDCIEEIKTIETDSIGFTVFSPPFAELYTYSDSLRDMGNAKDYDEFFIHFDYLVGELLRVTQPGRLVSIHCIDIPMMKERDGAIGLKDFPGDIIRAFQKHGFIYHSRHAIWKDPLIEATRTKALGLMHKQLMKDSSMCRSGLPDYLVTMRKPGTNKNPINHPYGLTEFIGEGDMEAKGGNSSHHTWRAYASPVWMDIRQGNTLNKNPARAEQDDKHICPLQLDTIDRALTLWSKEGDTVLSPFMGIGSEGYSAIKMNRRFVGIELKESYFIEAIKNLDTASIDNQISIFQSAS